MIYRSFYLLSTICTLLIFSSCQSSSPNANQSKSPNIVQTIPIARGYQICKIQVSVAKNRDFPQNEIENYWKEYLVRSGYIVVSRDLDYKKVINEHKTQFRDSSAKTRDHLMLGNISTADAILLIEATEWKTERKNRRTYLLDVNLVGRLIDVKTGNLIWIKNATYDYDNSSSSPLIALATLPFNILESFISPSNKTSKLGSALNNLMTSFPVCECQ